MMYPVDRELRLAELNRDIEFMSRLNNSISKNEDVLLSSTSPEHVEAIKSIGVTLIAFRLFLAAEKRETR